MLILNLNSRSAVNKETEIELMIELYSPDFIRPCETWYDESVAQNICLDGYTIIRQDRNQDFKKKYKKQHGKD